MEKITRRKFIAGGSLALTGTCICGLNGCATITGVGNTPSIQPSSYIVSSENKITVNLLKNPELKQMGKSVKIIDPSVSDSLIVVCMETNKYQVLSIKCTHRGTEVEYQPENKQFQCASLGGSRFRMDGKVIDGPAEKPLQQYSSFLSGDTLTIQL